MNARIGVNVGDHGAGARTSSNGTRRNDGLPSRQIQILALDAPIIGEGTGLFDAAAGRPRHIGIVVTTEHELRWPAGSNRARI